jgi:hypothetical protein
MADLYAVVKRHMDQRGMSLRALARAVHHDASYLSKALRGVKPLGPALARDIDTALGADGEITAAALRPPPRPEEVPVAPELVDYFRQQLAGHYAADRFLGPGRLIAAATAQYDLLCDIAGTAREPIRGELWATAAGFAGLLGWLHQDAGGLAASARWHDVMIERAHRSTDPQLVGFALYCKAMLHTDMGDGPGVLDLAGAGLRGGPELIPKVLALLLQQAAHGYSLRGDAGAAGQCDRLLGEAAEQAAQVSDSYPWGACTAPRWIDTQRATIWTRLGRHGEAAALWSTVIPAVPASSRRDIGVFSVRHAQALAGAGEPEQAVTVARGVMPVATQSGSARMHAELRTLRRRMEPWRGDQAWRDLDEAMRALPHAGKAG